MHDPRSWEQIQNNGRILEGLLAADPVNTSNSLGLDGEAGPFPVPGFPDPTLPAKRWGWNFAYKALGRLAPWIEREKPFLSFTNRGPIFLEPPTEFDHTTAQLGIPLTFACLPGLGQATLTRCAAQSWKQMTGHHTTLERQLATTVALEHHLWQRAGYTGIPYSVAYCAVSWLCGRSETDTKVSAYSLCLRCGELLQPRRSTKAQLRCDWCLKESPEARIWPGNAVMPHDRGRWLLRCSVTGCENVFIGHRQARRCEPCVRQRKRAEV